jgi:hypothetical protein
MSDLINGLGQAALGGLGQAALGAIRSGVNATPYGTPANQNAQGRQGGGGITAQDVLDYAKRNNLNIDPNAVLNDQYRRNEEQANSEFSRQQQGAAYLSGLGNANANQSTQRDMAINAQQNQANLVGQQLNALQQARDSGARAITAAMNLGAAGIR